MIFEINFFLFGFAQSNIWSYTFVYAKHYASATNVQFGALAMVLPALALIAKPMVCSLSDAHGAHKQFLISALAVFGISYGSLGILPFFKDPYNHENDLMAWIIICILMTIGYVSCACIFCMNDALASNHARKHNKSYAIMRIYANSGWALGALVVMLVGEISWLPFRVFGCIVLAFFILVDILILVLWPYPEDFEMFHDGSTFEERKLSIVGPNTMAYMAQNRQRGSISKDMLAKIRAGRSKSLGAHTIIEEIIKPNVIVAFHSKQKAFEEQIEQPKEYTNFQCQMILLKMIATKHKSFLRYIMLFTIFGVIQAMVWNYELDFFREHLVRDEAEFEFISTLCMISQSLFGDILINLVASQMIRLFGSNANLSLALVALGLRCFFYGNLLPYLGMYSVIIPEALQGPSLGLYWVLQVDVGSNYALMVTEFMPELKRRKIVRDRKHEEELTGCLRATMIGMMSSSMEGLGVALGSLIGGLMSAKYGYISMWNFCAIISFATGFLNIGWDLMRKFHF